VGSCREWLRVLLKLGRERVESWVLFGNEDELPRVIGENTVAESEEVAISV